MLQGLKVGGGWASFKRAHHNGRGAPILCAKATACSSSTSIPCPLVWDGPLSKTQEVYVGRPSSQDT